MPLLHPSAIPPLCKSAVTLEMLHCHWDQVIGDQDSLNRTLVTVPTPVSSAPGSTLDQRTETVLDDEVGGGGTWFF